MTASTVKSASITGFDSVPVTLQQGSKQGNKAKEYKETYEVATTSIDEVGDIIKMIRLPSRLRVSEIIIYNDDMDSNGTPTLAADVGLYNSQSGSVADADCFGSAITTLQSANTLGVNVCNEAADIANMGKMIWEYCSGVTSDPQVPLDLALTITTQAATAVAGTLSIVVRGSLDN